MHLRWSFLNGQIGQKLTEAGVESTSGLKPDARTAWPIISFPRSVPRLLLFRLVQIHWWVQSLRVLQKENVSKGAGNDVGGRLFVPSYQFHPCWHVSRLSCEKNALASEEETNPALASLRTCENQWCLDKLAINLDICSASSSSLSSAKHNNKKTSITSVELCVCAHIGSRRWEGLGR